MSILWVLTIGNFVSIGLLAWMLYKQDRINSHNERLFIKQLSILETYHDITINHQLRLKVLEKRKFKENAESASREQVH